MAHNAGRVNADAIFSFVAGGIFLALAALTAIRGRRSALALPTALLCLALWAYNTFEALSNLQPDAPHWEWIESASAALAAPLLLHLTLTFLGQRRARRGVLVGAYAYFGAVALSCLAPALVRGWAAYPGGDLWALSMLAGIVPLSALAGWQLVRHYRGVGHPEERARTQLFLASVTIGVLGSAVDLASIAGAEGVPLLAAPAMVLSAILLSALALRARFLRGTQRTLALNAALLAVTGVTLHVLVFRWLGGRLGLLLLGTVIVTALILAAGRGVGRAYSEVKERTTQLATLGRLSSQMAHDIRNPLAAIQGAAQYLAEERRRGASLEDQGEFIDLILDQVARLDRVVEDYRRLGRAEPRLERTDLDALLAKVAASARLHPEASGAEVTAEARGLGEASVDPELLTTALDNLVRNALEALDGAGGHVALTGARDEVHDALILAVRDDGPGMDARTREQAEEAFFTTKAQGSGLGLAFARRVAEAHGGRMRVTSALDAGTTVELVLPASRPSSPPG